MALRSTDASGSADRLPRLCKDEQKECKSDLNDPEHQNEIFRMATQMVKERQDITRSNCLKGVSGKVIIDEKGIKDSWKEYMVNLKNEVEYQLKLNKDQQIASGSVKLLQH